MQTGTQSGTRSRGFASMNSEKQREIARKGGKAAHEKGTAHEFTADEARAAGRKGGERVSQNREHMSRIGRIGGKSSASRRSTTEGRGAPATEHGGPDGGTGRSDMGQGHPGDGGGHRSEEGRGSMGVAGSPVGEAIGHDQGHNGQGHNGEDRNRPESENRGAPADTEFSNPT